MLNAQTNTIKRFTVKDSWKDYEVTLEVNLGILTVEKAVEINDFWSSSERRLSECRGDVQLAVIRLFGQSAICTMLAEGGSSFGPKDEAGPIWSTQLRAEEGWGAEGGKGEDNGAFGWCGIRIIGADVDMPSFHDLVLEEVAHG